MTRRITRGYIKSPRMEPKAFMGWLSLWALIPFFPNFVDATTNGITVLMTSTGALLDKGSNT